ncbi:MAG: hypothetical protein K5644_10125 [Lachnospiraceae bacterium]|nr:hypothetical protein [Lachnospiraceae bacterium]
MQNKKAIISIALIILNLALIVGICASFYFPKGEKGARKISENQISVNSDYVQNVVFEGFSVNTTQ